MGEPLFVQLNPGPIKALLRSLGADETPDPALLASHLVSLVPSNLPPVDLKKATAKQKRKRKRKAAKIARRCSRKR